MSMIRSAKPRRGKKRPRVFPGTHYRCRQKELAQSVQEDPDPVVQEDTEPFARPSASKRKLTVNHPAENVGIMTSGISSMLLRPRATCSTSSSSGVDGSKADSWKLRGNRIIGCDKLVACVGMVRHCAKGSLSVSEGVQRGLVTRITVSCGGCGWFCHLSDSYEQS